LKKYTHAWIALMAAKRLQEVKDDVTPKNKEAITKLLRFIRENNDGIVQGAWFPDSVIHDNSTGHIWKLEADSGNGTRIHKLPSTSKVKKIVKDREENEAVNLIAGNLPDRCQALAYEIRDKLKIKHNVAVKQKNPGAAIIPTNNEIALSFFMLAHYVADAHMPLHCDSRKFRNSIHGHIEAYWEDAIKNNYTLLVDPARKDKQFELDCNGFPKAKELDPFLTSINEDVKNRRFVIGFGSKNSNVWDYVVDICYYSYILSTEILPLPTKVNITKLQYISTHHQDLMNSSEAILGDVIDSLARIWLDIWKNYEQN
jgi:hypothetical protein